MINNVCMKNSPYGNNKQLGFQGSGLNKVVNITKAVATGAVELGMDLAVKGGPATLLGLQAAEHAGASTTHTIILSSLSGLLSKIVTDCCQYCTKPFGEGLNPKNAFERFNIGRVLPPYR